MHHCSFFPHCSIKKPKWFCQKLSFGGKFIVFGPKILHRAFVHSFPRYLKCMVFSKDSLQHLPKPEFSGKKWLQKKNCQAIGICRALCRLSKFLTKGGKSLQIQTSKSGNALQRVDGSCKTRTDWLILTILV